MLAWQVALLHITPAVTNSAVNTESHPPGRCSQWRETGLNLIKRFAALGLRQNPTQISVFYGTRRRRYRILNCLDIYCNKLEEVVTVVVVSTFLAADASAPFVI